MLKIHKPFSKKLLLISITSICITFGLLGLYTLTYTPELSHADSVTFKKTIEDITYMQEMTPNICQSMELEKQYQLVDKRDGKVYWVARLRDDNCWMTQNLDLDLNTEMVLTDELSDVEYWKSTSDTQVDVITTFPSAASGAGNFSYDPGEYVYMETNPLALNNCGVYTDTNTMSGCKKWQLTPGLSALKNSDERAHYLAGNYYDYAVATAGKSLTATSKLIDSSICPKGWGLPIGDSMTTNGSFGNLFTQYGWNWNSSGVVSDDISGGTNYNVVSSPFYFLRSGHISQQSVYGPGGEGRYWSASVWSISSHSIYDFFFYVDVHPTYQIYDWMGDTIRCIAKQNAKNNNIEVAIKPALTIETEKEIVVEKSPSNPSIVALNAKVSSNMPYTISISSNNPDLSSSTSSTTISSTSGLLNTNTNGWGIKLEDDTEFTAITSDLQTFYTASGAEIKTIPFTIGISTAPDLPNGEYSTDITVTATQN